MTDMMPLTIVRVPFHGDELEAIRTPDDKVWVSLRRCCEAVGLAYGSQYNRLADKERSPWATIFTVKTVALDGKQREIVAIDLDSLPMWLATVEAGRVNEDIREKLKRYQCECAKVLRDHFFKTPTSRPSQPRPWSMRINDHVMRFKSRMLDAHPGCWSVITEVVTELLLVEDVLAAHAFPLRLADLPDGSIGRLYRDHRNGKPWALPTYLDCPLQTTNLLPDGQPFEARPNIYQAPEREHFDRWFRTVYIPERMPEYLANKASRDRKRWLEEGKQPPTVLTVARAANDACLRLVDRSAILPDRLARAMLLSHQPQQLGFTF